MLSKGDRSSGAHISWEVLVNVDQVADNSLGSSPGGLGPATALGVNMVYSSGVVGGVMLCGFTAGVVSAMVVSTLTRGPQELGSSPRVCCVVV